MNTRHQTQGDEMKRIAILALLALPVMADNQ
jgi:hypothetical protein